jgi:hypothetical protein
MRARTIAFIVAMCAIAGPCVLGSGCARHPSSGTNQVQSDVTPAPAPTAYIELHGVVRLSHGVPVKECYTGRPGTRLLNGYSVAFGHDAVVEGGEVLVPEFTVDGTYQESATKHSSGSHLLSWVILNIAQGPGFPHGTTLEERPDTTATITIARGGKEGHATFEHYRSLYGQNGDERGGDVSGTISWSCATITRGPAP